MNCTDFERRLEQYEATLLSEPERLEFAQHASTCPACRSLLEVVRLSETDVAEGALSDFSRAVLAQTSGSACGRCTNLLGDFLDGILSPFDNDLIGSHLGSCSSCREVHRAMVELKELLPQMSELTPDPAFAGEVVEVIGRLIEGRKSPYARLREFFQGLLERPRFSWEAAYLATLLVFALFGTPFSPVQEAGSRLLATLQEPEGLVAKAGNYYAEVKQIVDASDRARQTLGRLSAASLETAEDAIRQGKVYLTETQDCLGTAGTAVRTTIGKAYQKVRSPKSPRKG